MATTNANLIIHFIVFLIVTVSTFMINPVVGSLIVVPNVIFLWQLQLISEFPTALVFLTTPLVLFHINLEAFYVLSIHSIFYVAVIMMAENGQLAEEYHPQITPAPSPEKTISDNKYVINKKLLPVKLYYFFFMSAVGVLLPFIALYMKFLGFSSEEVGIIYGVMPFVGFFIRPVIGAVADKFKKHKLTLMLVTTLTGVFYFLLVLVPGRSSLVRVEISAVLKCNNQDSFITACSNLHKQTNCQKNLSDFIKSNSNNRTLPCNFTCLITPDDSLPGFSACFTDEVGSYNRIHCNGTLIQGKHLNFTVPNLDKLLRRNASHDLVGDQECWNFDLKNIEYEINSTHRALQILCGGETEFNCVAKCPNVGDCAVGTDMFDKSFYLFFFIFLLANITFAPIFPILDAAAYEALGAKHNLWGMQRAWGTLGFALCGVSIMFIKESYRQDFNISFYIFLPLSIISTVIAFFLPISSDIKCGQFVKNVCKLLSYGEVSAFLAVVMYFGLLTGALETFLYWYLVTIDGSSGYIVGTVMLVNCGSELPMLFVAGKINKKIGLVNCLYLTLVSYAIRLLVFSVITNPWLVVISEPLYGICFGLMYAAASSYASIIAPPGMSATIQGLLGGVHFGFGKGIGSFITGFMYDKLGPRWTWGTYSIVSVFILVGYTLLNKFVFTARHRPPSAVVRNNGAILDEQGRQNENLINNADH